ncbi:MAG: hypothetical protein JW857_04460 [Bacteroidales bacterium]|nr:hypothetical protein [Bacteroidales bacterium]
MEDLIYGLLIVGWLAYGIYAASKKSKANSTKPQRQNTSPQKDVLGTLFDSFFQENNTNPYNTTHPYTRSANKEELNDEEPETYTYAAEQENTDYLDKVPEPETESKVDTYSGTDNVEPVTILRETEKKDSDSDEEAEETFDLRQGIIAQAVLERPYQ